MLSRTAFAISFIFFALCLGVFVLTSSDPMSAASAAGSAVWAWICLKGLEARV